MDYCINTQDLWIEWTNMRNLKLLISTVINDNSPLISAKSRHICGEALPRWMHQLGIWCISTLCRVYMHLTFQHLVRGGRWIAQWERSTPLQRGAHADVSSNEPIHHATQPIINTQKPGHYGFDLLSLFTQGWKANYERFMNQRPPNSPRMCDDTASGMSDKNGA